MFIEETDISSRGAGLLLLFLALLPFGDIWFQEEWVVSIMHSEFPVKSWCYSHFWDADRFFGGMVPEVGFPTSNVLNNPDIVATIMVGGVGALLGVSSAFNMLLFFVMLGNLCSLYWLARQFRFSRISCCVGAVAFAWNSLLLSYGFASTISDLIHVWPYPLAVGWLLKGLRDRTPTYGLWAGVFLGLGFLTCPYNVVLFLPVLMLLLPFVLWEYGRDSWRVILYAALTGGVICMLYAWQLYSIMHSDTSLVQSDDVLDIRHRYPFSELLPQDSSRFTLYLSELFSFGASGLVVVEQVARFARSFYVGWVSLGLALWGIFHSKEQSRWLWGGILLVFVLIAAGPYINLSSTLHMGKPWNPLYLASYHLFKGQMILEPFRYFLVAMLGLSMLVTIGVECISRWHWRLVMGALIAIDLAMGSAVGFPLPATQYLQKEEMLSLRSLPDGGIIHLPFFIQEKNLFDREHFSYQRLHDHPIGDPIMGFPPQAYLNNQLMCQMLHAEQSNFPMHMFPCGEQSIHDSVQDLQDKGFVAIVIERNKYNPTTLMQISARLDGYLSSEEWGDSLLVYPIYHDSSGE